MLFLKTTYLEHFSFVDFDYIQFLKLNTIFHFYKSNKPQNLRCLRTS